MDQAYRSDLKDAALARWAKLHKFMKVKKVAYGLDQPSKRATPMQVKYGRGPMKST